VGWGFGAECFAGYIVEKSLSVDNLFVFVIIMATFAVPREHRQRVLIFGIIAALALRGVFREPGHGLAEPGADLLQRRWRGDPHPEMVMQERDDLPPTCRAETYPLR
jgi:hypothetical protein